MSDITMNISNDFETSKISFEDFREIILNDYKLAAESRYVSLLGRKEVLTGKAKFGIFGDGKEVAQLALSKVFKEGDWRSGYYRDQTFIFASGISNIYHFFLPIICKSGFRGGSFFGRTTNELSLFDPIDR